MNSIKQINAFYKLAAERTFCGLDKLVYLQIRVPFTTHFTLLTRRRKQRCTSTIMATKI